MIQNRRAYQLIHCRTRSRLLAGAAAVCGAACGHADLGLYHLLHRGGAPLPDSTQADRAALASLCPKPAAEETCPLLPPQDPAVTLSVIVPVYNGEATIGPCLDSILQQETSCTVQLIVVDSDSTDGTAAVLERYRALPGVLLCNCSAPRSAAAARNEGLRHAVGRWLMFVDSDDLLLPGAIRTLLEAAQRLDADVVQGGWQYLYTDGTHGPVQRYPAAVYAGAAAPERFELPGMPWGKVYRRELFAQVRFGKDCGLCAGDGLSVAQKPQGAYRHKSAPPCRRAELLDHGAAGSAGCCAGPAPRCAVPLHPDAAAFGFLLCHCIRPAAGNAAGCFPAVLCFVRKGAAARGRTAPPCPLGCPGAAAAGLWAVVPLRQKISVVII